MKKGFKHADLVQLLYTIRTLTEADQVRLLLNPSPFPSMDGELHNPLILEITKMIQGKPWKMRRELRRFELYYPESEWEMHHQWFASSVALVFEEGVKQMSESGYINGT